MPSFTNTSHLTDFISVGVQKNSGANGNWYVRVKGAKGEQPKYLALRIKYDPDGSKCPDEVKNKAHEVAESWVRRSKSGKSVHKGYGIHYIADALFNEIGKDASYNDKAIAEGRQPKRPRYGANTYWTSKKERTAIEIYNNYVYPFFEYIGRSEAYKHKRNSLLIDQVTPQMLDSYSDWVLDTKKVVIAGVEREVAPATINRGVSLIRLIFGYAKAQGLIDAVPSIVRPQRNERARRRREFTEDEYYRFQQAITKAWQEETNESWKDYKYLFFLYINLVASTGIRVPTGGNLSTLVKMADFKKTINHRTGRFELMLRRESEKLHDYDAVVLPSAIRYWEALLTFRDYHGVFDAEYAFVHPRDLYQKTGAKADKDGNKLERRQGRLIWSKGQPIKSFHKQFATCLKSAGIDNPKGAPQSERITFSSLRIRFITDILNRDPNLTISELCKVTGHTADTLAYYYDRRKTSDLYSRITESYEADADKPQEYDGIYLIK